MRGGKESVPFRAALVQKKAGICLRCRRSVRCVPDASLFSEPAFCSKALPEINCGIPLLTSSWWNPYARIIYQNFNHQRLMSMYKHYSDGRRRFLKMSALFGTAALISPAIARAEGGGCRFSGKRRLCRLPEPDAWQGLLCLGSFSPWLRSHGNDLQPQPVSLA